MPRLPQPGGDAGSWGDVLNAFLRVAHNDDGTLTYGPATAEANAKRYTDQQISAITPGVGQLIVGGPNGPVALDRGPAGTVLTSDDASPTGFSWTTP